MSKQDKKEPHPLEQHALTDKASGWFEIPCKGGPDSMFVQIEPMDVPQILRRAKVIIGPDRRSIMLEQVKRRMEHEQ